MDNAFEQVRENIERDISAQTSPSSNQETRSEVHQETSQDQAASQAIYELEKLGKFKFQGQEYTPKDLEKAFLRQQDYTKKTQEIAEQRKTFESDEKFYKNLHWDLEKVVKNPALAQEFIKVYPEKFHSYLKEYLMATEEQRAQASQPQKAQQGGPDVELLSRLNRLESYYSEQQIAKNETQIKQVVDEMSKKYPDAITDMVLARAYESHTDGVELTKEAWEKLFQDSDKQIKQLLKDRYGDLVKKQTEANSKARDVGQGGGSVGQAPKKFKNIREVGLFAERQLSGKNN